VRVRIQIDVDGITDELRKLPDRGKKVGKEVLGIVTQEIASVARATAPEKTGALRGSVRATRPVMTARGVISAGVMAGGRATAPEGHATNVYVAVQEVGHEHTRSGAEVTLHSETGQAHFIETPAMRLAPTVPDRLLERLAQESA